MLNILLVDDHELFRDGLKLILSDLNVAAEFFEASNCDAATTLAVETKFDIVLLDLALPDISGVPAVMLMREKMKGAKIVVISAETNPSKIKEIMGAKAAGFIPKSSSAAVMLAALRLIIAGGTYLPPDLIHGLNSSPGTSKALNGNGLTSLTNRQIETLRLATSGMGNKEIGRKLDISEATVKAHLSASFRALSVRNRTEAAAAATRVGIISGK